MSNGPSGSLDDIDFGDTLRGHRVGDRIFGRFILERELGRGGMGVVWLARDELLVRPVVLKFLPDVVRFDTTAVEELKEETRKGLELAHPNIVKVYDFNLDDRHAAISMEYVDGDTMAKLRVGRPSKVFESSEIKDWVAQMISGLHYAHTTARIVHRDLKPSNLIINRTADLRIMDFGIARSIADSVLRTTMREPSTGTLPYMSPQQALGKPASISDDVYSFGCTLYELLTGKPPFYTGNVMEQVRTVKPASIAERRLEFGVAGVQPVPEAWEAALQDCLAKEPAARPRDMREVGRRLELLDTEALSIFTRGSEAPEKSAPVGGTPAAVDSEPPTPTEPVPSLTHHGQTGQTGATLSPATASIAAPIAPRRLTSSTAAAAPATGKAARTAQPKKKAASPMAVLAMVVGLLFVLLLALAGGGYLVYERVVKPMVYGAPEVEKPGTTPPQGEGTPPPPVQQDPQKLRAEIGAMLDAGKAEQAQPLLAAYIQNFGKDGFATAAEAKLAGSAAGPGPANPEPPAPEPVELPKPAEDPVALAVPERFPTIQKALEAAKSGQIIRIKPGYYEEMLTLVSGVTLEPAGDQPVVVRAPGRNGSVLVADGVQGAVVRGLTFEHSGEEDVEDVRWAVVQIKASGVTLEKCQIRRGMGSGVAISGAGETRLSQCTIERNAWYGVMLERGTTALVEGCTIQQNGGPGVFVAHIGTRPVLRGNMISRNLHSGVVVEEEGQAQLEGNTSERNMEMGVALSGSGVSAVLKGNKLRDNKLDGIAVQDGARAELTQNEVSGNKRNGVVIYDAADGCMLTGNQVTGNSLDGIVLAIGPSGGGGYGKAVLRGNTVSGQSISGIRLIGNGVAPLVEGNIVHSNGQKDILATDGAAPVLNDNQLAAPGSTSAPAKPADPAPTPAPAPAPAPAVDSKPPVINAKNSGGTIPVLDPDATDDDSAMRRQEEPRANTTPPPPPEPAPESTNAPASSNNALPAANSGNVPYLEP